jgi:hypothetical protein
MFALQKDKIAIIEPTSILESSVDTPRPNPNMPIPDFELPVNVVPKISNKFKNAIQTVPFDGGETNLSTLEDMLETEKQNNKLAAWNKLDKMSRVQKLHAFAEKYGREHGLPVKEIRNLKTFFTTSLDKGRLNRAKDVIYDRESREVKSIPALHFNNDSKSFTLRNLEDAKRTLKCLTPSRKTPKQPEES